MRDFYKFPSGVITNHFYAIRDPPPAIKLF